MLDLDALSKLATGRSGPSKGAGMFSLAQESDFADKFDNVEAGAAYALCGFGLTALLNCDASWHHMLVATWR